MALFAGQSGQKGYGSYSPKKYAQAYKQQRGSYGLGSRQTLGVSNKEYLAAQPQKTSSFNFPLGGLLGGMGNAARYAEDDYNRQVAMNDLAYERSLPWDISGPLGSVTYDRENKTIKQEMSDDARGVMDRFLGRSESFGDEISTYDPMEMQKNLFNQQKGLFTEGDMLSELRAKEQAIARGTDDSTVNYWDERARLDNISRRDLGLQNDTFMQSQALLDSQIAREQGYNKQDLTLQVKLILISHHQYKQDKAHTQLRIWQV